ncbi:MAG TPA: ATP-binding protein [Opitutaceae bacterium]|jgi:signal transduction histidine kinase
MSSVMVLVGGDSGFISEAEGAARRLGIRDVRRTASVEEAKGLDLLASCLIALDAPSEGELRSAAEALDALSLPRWAVVARGPVPGAAQGELVAAPEWKDEPLARIFGLCLERHLLSRECAQFRGDLLSLGTRVAHDMRTPLGGIVVSCESVSEQVTGAGCDADALMRPILESEEDLLRIVKRMALFTGAFACRPSPEKIDASVPLSAALDRLGAQIARRKVKVVKADEWPEITADPRLLEIVWLVLIENAISHGGEGPRVEIGWRSDGQTIRFSVSDDGKGVPAGKLKLLFYPFHRLHEPSAARGLGLPIAERLVRLLGGSCGYQPAIPKGACFYFHLPMGGQPPA